MEQKTPWHIFFKSFLNHATQDELAEINDWLEKDVENLKFLEEVYNVFYISKILPSPLKPDTKKAWDKVDQQISGNSIFKKPLKLFFRYAAVIAAAVILGFLIIGGVDYYIENNRLANQFTEIITLPGQKTSVVLPDGSKVWINSASILKYSANFNKKEREILLSGEAYFEVNKDKKRRFRVKSGSINVDVYGTSFNIKNYTDEESQAITVAEGVVGVSGNLNESWRLTKGEQVTLNKKSGEIKFSEEDTEFITAWKNNELIFRKTPVEEVMKSIENWYGVKITLDNQMIGSHNYTFKIKTESLRDVLDLMKVMTPFEYKINGKDIEIKYSN